MSRLDETLNQINQTILRARSRDELFSKVCRSIVASAEFDVVWIDWLDSASGLFVLADKAGDPTGVVTEEFANQCHCALAVLQSGAPFIVHDLLEAPGSNGCSHLAESLELQGCAAYPIRLQNKVCGVLTAGTGKAGPMHKVKSDFLEQITLNLSFALATAEAERWRRETEDTANEGGHLLKSVLQSGLDGFYISDISGRLLEVNDAYCAMSGYSREELLRMRIPDLECSESEQDVAEHVRKIIQHGKDRFESSHRRKDGQVLYIETSVNFRNFNGGRFFCFLRDITERRRAEQALRESEERFRLVVEGSPIGILIQADGIYLYLNPAALAMFAAESADQMVGRAVVDSVHPDYRAAVNERLRLLKEERDAVPFLEQQFVRLDGTVFDAEVSAIRFNFDQHDGSIAFVRDLTESKNEESKRRALERQLLQAQKLESLGRLAGGIAHDFNNILMVIQTYAELLQNGLPLHDSLRRNSELVLRAAERGASLTGQMLAFSRKQIVTSVVLDLNAVIGQAAKMLMRLIGEDIEFNFIMADSLWAVKADQDQIFQVLMNLCVNARDAMPQGGTLTIATENVVVAESDAGLQPHLSPGEYVKFSVTDTGTGISKKIQQEIFEPFFTTKEVGKGTGLGLATVYGIAKQSGGYVTVDSDVGRGACFSLYLPKIEREAASRISLKTRALLGGEETLLVVEDEEFLRKGISEFLSSLGYTVLTACSGEDALRLVGTHGHIDLLLTDVVMPKLSGRELSHMLVTLRPALRVIHMSGHTDDAVLRYSASDTHAAFLQKPFSLATLARKVRELLDRSENPQ